MKFDPRNVYSATEKYFLDLFQRIKLSMTMDGGKNKCGDPQLRCISLLRLSTTHQECTLAKHYHEGINQTRSAIRDAYPQGLLDINHFDWLEYSKQYGIEAAVSELWGRTMPFLHNPGSDGSLVSVGMTVEKSVDRLIHQTNFVRVNCADSLDRTNLGCFFVCLQATLAMLATLRLPSANFQTLGPIPTLNDKVYFEKPPAAVVPHPFLSSWKDVMDTHNIPSTVVRALAEIFTENGDCVANLYTGSAAMHGETLRRISGGKGSGSNAVIATQRLFENTFEDRKKNRSIDLLLAQNVGYHFSKDCYAFFTLPIPYRQWYSAVVCEKIPPSVSCPRDLEPGLKDLLSSINAPFPRRVRIAIQDDSFTVENEPLPLRVAVIQFGEEEASLSSSLLQKGYMTLNGVKCRLVPYSHSIDNEGTRGSSGNFKSSFTDGVRQFFRGLN